LVKHTIALWLNLFKCLGVLASPPSADQLLQMQFWPLLINILGLVHAAYMYAQQLTIYPHQNCSIAIRNTYSGMLKTTTYFWHVTKFWVSHLPIQSQFIVTGSIMRSINKVVVNYPPSSKMAIWRLTAIYTSGTGKCSSFIYRSQQRRGMFNDCNALTSSCIIIIILKRSFLLKGSILT
jgi:hypothetical protein